MPYALRFYLYLFIAGVVAFRSCGLARALGTSCERCIRDYRRHTRKCSLLFSLLFVTINREGGSNSDEFFQSRQIRILSANDLACVAFSASARFAVRFVIESVRRRCLVPQRLQFGVIAAFDQDAPPGNQTGAHLRRERSTLTSQLAGTRRRRRNLCKTT